MVARGCTPNLTVVTTRNLLKLSSHIMELPSVTGWRVIIDSSSVVDRMFHVSGPDSTVVTHGDMEEFMVLSVEHIGPSITHWGGFSDSSSVVSFTFGVDTNELGVVA